MRYTAVYHELLDGHATLPRATIGAWVSILAYASKTEAYLPPPQEQNLRVDPLTIGLIRGARPWTDREWLVAAHVDRSEVAAVVAARLAAWVGEDLHVRGYDARGQRAHDAHRGVSRNEPGDGKAPRGRPRKNQMDEQSGKQPSDLESNQLNNPAPLRSAPGRSVPGRTEPNSRGEPPARDVGRGPAAPETDHPIGELRL